MPADTAMVILLLLGVPLAAFEASGLAGFALTGAVSVGAVLDEAILPEACRGLPAEPEAVDRLLDDAAFFEPYRAHFHATLGPPVGADRDVSAVDVPQVPLSAGVRGVVPGGHRLDQLAAVRADPVGVVGAASRAADTARAVGFDFETDERLVELDYGAYEGLTKRHWRWDWRRCPEPDTRGASRSCRKQPSNGSFGTGG